MTATIVARQAPSSKAVIEAACDQAFEQPYTGFENLLRAEVPTDMQAWFIGWFSDQGEWPPALAGVLPPKGLPPAQYADVFAAPFTHKKGSDFLTVFFEQCTSLGHLPPTMLGILATLKAMAAPPPPPAPPPAAPVAPDLLGSAAWR